MRRSSSNIHDAEGEHVYFQCSEYIGNQETFVKLKFGKLFEIVDFHHELDFNW